MSTPDLVLLEVLSAVAEGDSLTRAAAAAGLAQPNVSRLVARAERRLGTRLLDRTGHTATLTADGAALVSAGRSLLEEARTYQDRVAQLARTSREHLVVVASQTICEHLAPGWVAQLRRAHPEVTVRLSDANSSLVARAVRQGRADLGFVEGPSAPAGLHSLTVARDELVLVVAPQHPWAGRSSAVGRDELARTPLVLRERGSGTRVVLDRWLGEHGPAVAELELTSAGAVLGAVTAGAAPTVISDLAVRVALAEGRLRRVPMSGPPLRRRLRAVWSAPKTLLGVSADFVELALQPISE